MFGLQLLPSRYILQPVEEYVMISEPLAACLDQQVVTMPCLLQQKADQCMQQGVGEGEGT